MLALTLPVFAWAEVATDGRFGQEFFWAHNVERGLGGGRLRSHAWWLYVPYFLHDFLPWSPLVLAAAFLGRGRWWRADPLARFGLAWLLAVLLALSCSRFKRADYLVPAYPGAALFLGCVLERWRGALGARRAARLVAAVVGLAGVMLGAWAYQVERALPAEEPYRDYRAFAAEVRRAAPAPARVDFFRTEAHALAFHVGRPLDVVVEWADLQARLDQPGPHYLVMPPVWAAQWPKHLRGVRLEPVARNPGLHERPLVLLRSARAGVQRKE
jgi:4-amino-4-deoxy-L-arabinose transferase-like glycosyltransferase